MPRTTGLPAGLLLTLLMTLAPATARAGETDFARDIRPILSRCIRCHGPKKQKGGLRLDVRRRALAGGDTGPAIVPRRAAASELLRRVTAQDEDWRMPPSGKPLAAADIARLRTWIDKGAAWPDELAGKEEYDNHWAFKPVRRPAVPQPRTAARVRNAVDAFVLARLEKHGLSLSPEAGKRVLLRRLYLDLIGLPPSPAQVKAFLNNPAPNAYENVVDRLLASPHFGERWARHWLDLARFAESDGYENDRLRPNAWRFRDWVVAAINADMPFDQFTVEQLAGDLLPGATASQRSATGFHRNTLHNSAASADKEEFRVRAVRDRVDTTGTTWLGLTLGCAKCHSHKYDPVTQREYYQLYAFFNSTDHDEVAVPGGKASALKAVPRPSHVLRRGSFLDKGVAVMPRTPAFLPPLRPRGATADRLDLARWLVRPDHPLTARVAANHIWQHLFGRGLVTTPDNFGRSGSPPSHPELLDWLASELVRRNWSRKALIRTVVLSSVYRQASNHRTDAAAADPENILLARQNRLRVEAEIVRDLTLSVAGLLDRKLGGPSIVPPFPEGLLEQRVTNEALKMPTPAHWRRGLYIHVQRTLAYPMLAAFDAADGNQPCARRDRTTTPVQALTRLNDPVFVEAASALGKRLQKLAVQPEDRLRGGFRLCLGRSPEPRELALLLRLVEEQRRLGANEDAVWTGVARTLLNLDEFITRE